MPVIIAPVDAYPANFTTFADGDAVSQANFVGSMQEFADAITYLRNRTLPAVPFTLAVGLGAPAGMTFNGSAVEPPTRPVSDYPFLFDSGTMLWAEAKATPAIVNSISWALDLEAALPAGSGPFQITGAECWTINVTGHGGLTPAAPQSVSIDYRQPSVGPALQNVVSFSDGSAAAVLDTLHAFSSAPLTHAMLSGARYYISYTSETGANAAPDTQLHGMFLTIEPV